MTRPEITGKKTQTTQPSLERLTYTIEEAAEMLGISRALAYRRGVLPTVKIAGRRLVPKVALDRMLAKTA
jgi:excisionase family DNA binding protein